MRANAARTRPMCVAEKCLDGELLPLKSGQLCLPFLLGISQISEGAVI